MSTWILIISLAALMQTMASPTIVQRKAQNPGDPNFKPRPDGVSVRAFTGINGIGPYKDFWLSPNGVYHKFDEDFLAQSVNFVIPQDQYRAFDCNIYHNGDSKCPYKIFYTADADTGVLTGLVQNEGNRTKFDAVRCFPPVAQPPGGPWVAKCIPEN